MPRIRALAKGKSELECSLMPRQDRAWITINGAWIKQNGLGSLFKGAWATGEGDAVVEVRNYSLEDGWFVEINFKPSSLNGRAVRILVPRAAVQAIIVPERNKDAALLGFKNAK